MTENVKKRRRWPWLILAATLILVCGPTVWRLRPLNATERRLVGSWSPEHDSRLGVFTFRADRAFCWTHPNGFVAAKGSWSASARSLVIDYEPDGLSIKQLLFRLYRRLAGHDRQPLRFAEDGDLILHGIPFDRVATPLGLDR